MRINRKIWVVIAGGASVCLLVLAGAVALAASGDDGSSEDEGQVTNASRSTSTPTAGTTTGVELSCGGELKVRSYFNQVGVEYVVIGELTDADGGHFTVKGPTGRLPMTLAIDSDVEGTYVIGEPIEVGGRRLDNGDLEAIRVRPGCLAVAGESSTPSDATPTATMTPGPSQSPGGPTPPPRTLPPFFPPPTFAPAPFEEEPIEEPVVVTEAPTAPPVTEAPTPPPPPPTEAPTEDPRPTRTSGAGE